MERVLEFLYKGQYTPPEKAKEPQNQASASSPPAKRAKVVIPTAPVATSNANIASSKTIEKGSTSVTVVPNEACFHAAVLAEADYFMIPKLKMQAKERFNGTFVVQNRSHFAETVKEIYSSRANYAPLKAAILRHLFDSPWRMSWLVDDKLVKLVPDFGVDLFAGIVKRIQEQKLKLEIVYKNDI